MTLGRLLSEVGVAADHLARAVENFDRRCRQDGHDASQILAALLPAVDKGGPGRTKSRKPTAAVQTVPSMLLNYSDAAAVLAVSVRSVQRLVAGNELAVVRVGNAPRIHRRDLTEFVERKRRFK